MKRMTWNWLLALLLVPLNSIRPAVGAEAVAVIAIDADPGHFNPAITTGVHVHAVADSIFNGLVGLDQSQMPTPDLAAAWQVSADGRTYTFRLVEARWHDGEPFTSADVKFTFENVLLKWHAHQGGSRRSDRGHRCAGSPHGDLSTQSAARGLPQEARCHRGADPSAAQVPVCGRSEQYRSKLPADWHRAVQTCEIRQGSRNRPGTQQELLQARAAPTRSPRPTRD